MPLNWTSGLSPWLISRRLLVPNFDDLNPATTALSPLKEQLLSGNIYQFSRSITHKIPAPTSADADPATELARRARLVLGHIVKRLWATEMLSKSFYSSLRVLRPPEYREANLLLLDVGLWSEHRDDPFSGTPPTNLPPYVLNFSMRSYETSIVDFLSTPFSIINVYRGADGACRGAAISMFRSPQAHAQELMLFDVIKGRPSAAPWSDMQFDHYYCNTLSGPIPIFEASQFGRLKAPLAWPLGIADNAALQAWYRSANCHNHRMLQEAREMIYILLAVCVALLGRDAVELQGNSGLVMRHDAQPHPTELTESWLEHLNEEHDIGECCETLLRALQAQFTHAGGKLHLQDMKMECEFELIREYISYVKGNLQPVSPLGSDSVFHLAPVFAYGMSPEDAGACLAKIKSTQHQDRLLEAMMSLEAFNNSIGPG